MFNISSNTKFFVFCPVNYVTGGAELLHQLVDKLNNNGLDSYIVYSEADTEVTSAYDKYNIKIKS